jgi:hypothetical protein
MVDRSRSGDRKTPAGRGFSLVSIIAIQEGEFGRSKFFS